MSASNIVFVKKQKEQKQKQKSEYYSITKFRKRLFSPFVILYIKSDNVYLDIHVPVVQTLGSVFQRISHYTADKYILGKTLA